MSMQSSTRRSVGRVGISVLAMATLACSKGPRTGIIASSDLVSLVASVSGGKHTLRLDAAPGARINARLPPVLALRDSTRVTFASASLTSDSSYFIDSPTTSLNTVKATRGTLLASVCPANLRVCLSVTLDVRLR